MSKKLQLHQYLSKSGRFHSKDDVYQAIRDRNIMVDGKIVPVPHFQLSPKQTVSFNRETLTLPDTNTYLVLNKPRKYTCQKGEPKNVFMLLRGVSAESQNSLMTVGRLDEDTTGLLIITDDGKLASSVTDPKRRIPKTYAVRLNKPLEPSQKEFLEHGIEIVLEENGKENRYLTQPCEIVILRDHVQITIYEGKKREIRRMFEAIGNKVVLLDRIAIGNLRLKDMHIAKGEWKIVDKETLFKKIGLL